MAEKKSNQSFRNSPRKISIIRKYRFFHPIANALFPGWPWQKSLLIFLASISLFFIILGIINLVQIRSESQFFDRAYATKLNLELSFQIQNMREQVVQVEQWLVDISATLGLDNLNDGYELAQKNASLFDQGLPILANILSKQNPKKNFSTEIHSLDEKFKAYYHTGLDMTKAYINSGTLEGNALMKQFRSHGKAVEEKLEAFVTAEQGVQLNEVNLKTKVNFSWLPPARLWKIVMERKSYLNYARAKEQILTDISDTSNPRLAYLAQRLRVDILRIQHWLTAVSVTRARDGMDEGFARAREHFDHFHASLAPFQKLLEGESGQQEGSDLVKNLENKFNSYYQEGLTMADAYIRGGTILGNPVMAVFDAESAKLAYMLSPFLEQSLEKTGLGEFQINFATRSLQEMTWVLLGLVVSLLTVFFALVWSLRTFPQTNPNQFHR